MADGVAITPGAGATIATDDIAGQQYQRVKVVLGADGVNDGDVSSSNALPVSGPLTDTQLRASAVSVNQAGVSATGTLTALNATRALTLNGASGWAVDLRGTFTATVTFQGTIDGTNWFTIAVVPAGGTVSVASVTTATAAGAWWGNATGLQQVRAIATAYTSGTVTVTLRAMLAAGVVSALVTGATTTPVSGTVSLGSTSRHGFIAASGIWYDDSATTLAGAATFTGTARDLIVTATATQWANVTAYGKELRVSAESDVTGTLWLEVSRDNTNWRRAKSVATSAVTGGGFYAEIVHQPSWRYARVGYTNGAGAQARFSIGTFLLAI